MALQKVKVPDLSELNKGHTWLISKYFQSIRHKHFSHAVAWKKVDDSKNNSILILIHFEMKSFLGYTQLSLFVQTP